MCRPPRGGAVSKQARRRWCTRCAAMAVVGGAGDLVPPSSPMDGGEHREPRNPYGRGMLSTLLALHLLASAQITPPPPPAEPTTLPATTPAPTWYGWQTLIADGAVILVTGTGFILATNGYAKPGNSIAGAGGGSYVIPAPIVHLGTATCGGPWAPSGSRSC